MASRCLSLCGLIVAAGLAVASVGPAAAERPTASTYEASASADGLRVATAVPGAPLSDALVDASSGSAQALVNGLGTSRAFASAPYPGATLSTLPDTIRGAGGAPLPSYPLIASSDHPGTPEALVAQPGVHLQARSRPGASEARVATGADDGDRGAGRAIGHVTVGPAADGTVAAEATTDTAGLVVGPVTLGRIVSGARVVRGASGDPQRDYSLEITPVVVAGQPVNVTSEGLVFAGTRVPLPDTHPARTALDQTGVTLRYLEPVSTPDGVVAPGLAVTQVVPASLTGSPSTVTYTVGRASAAVLVGADPLAGDQPLPDILGGEASSQFGSGSPQSPAEPVADPSGGIAEITAVPVPVSAAAGSSSPGATTATEQTPADVPGGELAGPAPVAAATVGPVAKAWSNGLYLVFVTAGAVLAASFAVLRQRGVKTTWVS
jgi:hypothetical protein